MLPSELVPAIKRDSRRLMLVLHGLGDSPEGYRWLPESLKLDWLNYLLITAPDPYYGGFSWYDIYEDPAPGVERSRKLLFELLDDLRKKGVNAEDMVCFGFSQGCLMSLEIGARYPARLAGIVGISGYAHKPEQLVRELSPVATRQRFLITHGTQDPLIPIQDVRPQVELLRKAGLQIDWREFNKQHTIAGETELAVIRDFVRAGFNGVQDNV
jgi:phospholipase/carboxylesterase